MSADSAGADLPSGGGETFASFRATSSGVAVRIGPSQAAIFRELVANVAGLIGSSGAKDSPANADDELAAIVGMSDRTEPPDDPILARLLPDAYRDDPDAAGEFRRFTESGLRAAKAAAAQTVLDTLPARGGRIKLAADQAEQWLRALNDVRLALGVVLGVTEDFSVQTAQISEKDPRYTDIAIYDWLTYLQESLVEALSSRRLRSREC